MKKKYVNKREVIAAINSFDGYLEEDVIAKIKGKIFAITDEIEITVKEKENDKSNPT